MTTTPTTERDDGEIEEMVRAYDETPSWLQERLRAARDALDAYRAAHAPKVEAGEYAELIGRLHARVRNTSTIGIFKSDGFKEAPDADCVEAATAIETLERRLAAVLAPATQREVDVAVDAYDSAYHLGRTFAIQDALEAVRRVRAAAEGEETK